MRRRFIAELGRVSGSSTYFEVVAPTRHTPGRRREIASRRFDAAVAQHLRSSGKGWQTRLNNAVAGLIADGKL